MAQPMQGDGLAWLVGANAALLQVAGALKSIPFFGSLPIDLTVLLVLAALPLLALQAVGRRWVVAPAIGLPFAAIGALWLWLVLAGCWSASGAVLNAKLSEIILLGPLMLLTGMVVAGDDTALRGFSTATLGAGVVIAISLAENLAEGEVALGGLPGAEAEKWRIAYQVTGLAITMAAALAALHWAEAQRAGARFFWLGMTLALSIAALLPAARAALVALGLCLALGPALIFLRQQKPWRATFWVMGLGLLSALGLMSGADAAASHARALDRLLAPETLESSGRLPLWGAALALAGDAMPFGLGTGGFSLAAGFGEWRGRHPHNLALEALVEAGLPGFALWLAVFGGAGFAIWRLGRRAPSWRVARIMVLCLPIAVTLQVSTDLGNRMAWLALGLALGLGLGVEAKGKRGQHVRAMG
jgi:O-antigen ligase